MLAKKIPLIIADIVYLCGFKKIEKMIKKITPFLVVIMFLFVACNQNNTPKDKVDESEKTQCSLDYISQNDTNSYSDRC